MFDGADISRWRLLLRTTAAEMPDSQSPPSAGGADAFPDQTCPSRTASSVVACAFGLTKSYLMTLASVPPGATPLTSRLAPVVVLVVATLVPAGPPNGSKLAISRN